MAGSQGFCPRCGTARTGSFRFCRSCGLDLEAPGGAGPAGPPSEEPPVAPRVQLPAPSTTAAPPSASPSYSEKYAGTPYGQPVAPVTPGQPAQWVPPGKSNRGRWLVVAGVAVLVFVGIAALAGRPDEDTGPTGGGETATPRSTSTSTPTPTPTATPTPRPTVYATLTARSWEQVVKSPDDYVGHTFRLWACITQFDAATGPDTFRGQASYDEQEFWYSDADNVVFTGDADLLKEFVQDDVVAMDVMTLGSITYDTQIGGSTTAPAFEVVRIALEGSCSI
jgi:hypothetical protein